MWRGSRCGIFFQSRVGLRVDRIDGISVLSVLKCNIMNGYKVGRCFIHHLLRFKLPTVPLKYPIILLVAHGFEILLNTFVIFRTIWY